MHTRCSQFVERRKDENVSIEWIGERPFGLLKHTTITHILLALSRALGDFAFKASGVICKPYFATREIKSDDVCVVLASDGLWDVMDEDVKGCWKQLVSTIFCQITEDVRVVPRRDL